jgi:hypothetical protein
VIIDPSVFESAEIGKRDAVQILAVLEEHAERFLVEYVRQEYGKQLNHIQVNKIMAQWAANMRLRRIE